MSVLSDRTIRGLCDPTHIEDTDTKLTWVYRPDLPEYHQVVKGDNTVIDYRPYDPAHVEKDHPFVPMIDPYFPTKVKVDEQGNKIASYGQSSAGYDIRCAPEFKLFCGVDGEPIDYKNIRDDQFETIYADKVILPPNSFVLSRSIEKVCMPRDVIAVCLGKSTPSRAAISCLSTPIEPGWEGYITLEFANTSNQPVILYANEGAVQLLFLRLDQDCENAYNDGGVGKYNNQLPEITLPRV